MLKHFPILLMNYSQGTVDTPDEKGLTGLMWAAGYGQLGSARQLLKAGANKNYRGLSGDTPLHLAAAYGHHDLVKLLLNHGADSNAIDEVQVDILSIKRELWTTVFLNVAGRKYAVDLRGTW